VLSDLKQRSYEPNRGRRERRGGERREREEVERQRERERDRRGGRGEETTVRQCCVRHNHNKSFLE